LLPGLYLVWHLGAARQRGLGVLSDGELIGTLAAVRQVRSWQAGLELAATAELDARRAGPDGREGEHVDDELSAPLTLTGRVAARPAGAGPAAIPPAVHPRTSGGWGDRSVPRRSDRQPPGPARWRRGRIATTEQPPAVSQLASRLVIVLLPMLLGPSSATKKPVKRSWSDVPLMLFVG
jgi:hypothetical protein